MFCIGSLKWETCIIAYVSLPTTMYIEIKSWYIYHSMGLYCALYWATNEVIMHEITYSDTIGHFDWWSLLDKQKWLFKVY